MIFPVARLSLGALCALALHPAPQQSKGVSRSPKARNLTPGRESGSWTRDSWMPNAALERRRSALSSSPAASASLHHHLSLTPPLLLPSLSSTLRPPGHCLLSFPLQSRLCSPDSSVQRLPWDETSLSASRLG
ncbi:hypothetical protein M432DRAFT_417878 [Thermoascus aurantiacus ATCC 26904]